MTITAAAQLGIPALTQAEMHAIKQWVDGVADAGQQQIAAQAVLKLTNLAGASYRQGDPHATAYAEGQRSVGLALTMIATRSPDFLAAHGLVTKENVNDGSQPGNRTAAADTKPAVRRARRKPAAG